MKSCHIVVILLFLIKFTHSKRGPHHPRGDFQMTKDEVAQHFNHDNEQMQEDLIGLNVNHIDFADMSDEDKSFYYFKVHDTDNNDHLDGLEMLNAATHHGSHNHDEQIEDHMEELNHIVDVIDSFLDLHDLNKNGLLSYAEYQSMTMQSQKDGITDVVDTMQGAIN